MMAQPAKPIVVYHADWGSKDARRWCAKAGDCPPQLNLNCQIYFPWWTRALIAGKMPQGVSWGKCQNIRQPPSTPSVSTGSTLLHLGRACSVIRVRRIL